MTEKFNLIQITKDKLIINSDIFSKICYKQFKIFNSCMNKNNSNYIMDKKCMEYLKNWKKCLAENI